MTVIAGPRVSTVVLSWNTEELLRSCLLSLRAMPDADRRELIVVDNGSDDDSAGMVEREFPEARLIRTGRNLGYAEGNNVGIRAARGRYVLLLNSDTEVEPDSISRLADFLDRNPEYGAVGAQLLSPDGSIQQACMRFPTLAVAIGFDTWFGKWSFLETRIDHYFYADFDHTHSEDVDQPPGTALMVPRKVYDKVGLLDPDLFLFYNDVDLCRRIRKSGYRIRYLADARILHHGGASTSRYGSFAAEWHKNRARYYLRSHGRFGFWLAKVMSAWRAWELWWKEVRNMSDPLEKAAATRHVRSVAMEVLRDRGSGDARVRAEPAGEE
ncbi:MAG: glycosyltransferase family 2 protein [Planctomycetota bacterium]